MAAALALLSSVLWGTADFGGGVISRRIRAVHAVAWSQFVGLVTVLILVAALGSWKDPDGWLPWSVLAGVAGVIGLVAFYTSLAIGTMGVVSPIAALGVAVPVVIALAAGDQPNGVQVLGMGIAFAGALAASGPELSGARTPGAVRSIALALVAAVAFGCALTGMQRGSDTSPVMTLLGMRITSVALFAVAALVTRTDPRVPAREGRWLIGIGVADVMANATFMWASTQGMHSVVVVLGSLYPVVTVLMGRFLLNERMSRIQGGGVALALVGIAVLASG